MSTTAQFVRANAKVEKIMDSACLPEWAISSQGAWEQVQGSTSRLYGPDRTMEAHERVAPRKRMMMCSELRRESQNSRIKNRLDNTTCGKVNNLAFVKSRGCWNLLLNIAAKAEPVMADVYGLKSAMVGTISRQTTWEQAGPSTTRAWSPDRTVKPHERGSSDKFVLCSFFNQKGQILMAARIDYDVNEFKNFYLKTLSTRKTAEKFGVSRGTVRNRLIELGIEDRGTPQRLTPRDEAVIVQMAKAGMPASAAAVRFQMNITTMYNIARKHGVKFENVYHDGVQIKTEGYISLYTPHHPRADSKGYVLEHRLVMEKKLGRFLEPDEVVHHIDFNRSNNDPENLVLFASNGDHARHHQMLRKRKSLQEMASTAERSAGASDKEPKT